MTAPHDPTPEPPRRGRRRAGKRPPGSGWIPGVNDPAGGTPFLPPLPQHSETGILFLKEPHKRRKKLVRRTIVALILRWRYFVTTLAAIGLVLTSMTTGLVLFRDSSNNSDSAPFTAAPSLEALNNAITLGERYINALYKPLPDGSAVQSEASGVPLKAHFTESDTWVLLGEEKEVCLDDGCSASSAITPIETGERDEKYTVSFSSAKARDAFRGTVSIDWDFKPDAFQLTVSPLAAAERTELWLDETKLGVATPNLNQPLMVDVPFAQQSQMRMLRFTIRHATQEAYLYWSTYGNDPKKARALADFLEQNDYQPGYDMRAPLFDKGDDLPDNLPFDVAAYEDCDHVAQSNIYAYAYRSKVCLFRQTYLDVGQRDPFLQAWQALTTLMKYDDPNRELARGGWWLQGNTPADVAHHLQGHWNTKGIGIPKCTPFSCNEMSNIRTSVFGALQTQLGYKHGNASSKQFADAAASMIVKTQIGTDGTFTMYNGTFYRPMHVGAFRAAWDTAEPRYIVPSTPQLVTGVAFLVTGEQPIPPEYLGIVPSNSETSFDALAFLNMYRCVKYNVC